MKTLLLIVALSGLIPHVAHADANYVYEVSHYTGFVTGERMRQERIFQIDSYGKKVMVAERICDATPTLREYSVRDASGNLKVYKLRNPGQRALVDAYIQKSKTKAGGFGEFYCRPKGGPNNTGTESGAGNAQ